MILVASFTLWGCGGDAPVADTAELTALPAPSADGPASSGAVSTPSVERPVGASDTPEGRLDARPAQQELDQPAIWPAADVVFATPEEAAADFVAAVLVSEGDPVLGEFQQGDARSGEITVLFEGETGELDPPNERGVLVLRQLGPTDGWYVIAATSEGVEIDTPTSAGQVTASTTRVAGSGRGFEGTLIVSAFRPGDPGAEFDLQIGAGGAFEEREPFEVELDLSGAAAGEVVVILVRGDTGLGSDPGDFAAIPVVVTADEPTATLPPTR